MKIPEIDLEKAREIVNANAEIRDESFLFFLHERDTFRRDKYEELIKSIEILADECNFDRGTAYKLYWISECTISSFLWHYDPHDDCKLKKVPKYLGEVLQDMEAAVSKYFNK